MQMLLNIKNLSVAFDGQKVIRDVSLCLQRGRVMALVGESGSGKSMTARSIMRLVPRPGRIISGEIDFCGTNLLLLPESDMRAIRGKSISMIFQEPMTSLNPVLTIGRQVAEPLEVHEGISTKKALKIAASLLERVGIPAAASRLDDYPHQFSGGMRQRVMIAMALACSPSLLLADEPTTALDITIQRQILQLLRQVAQQRDMGVLLITHDLGVVAECADDVSVMYAGEIIEQCTAETFFRNPLHPYSKMLMECAPTLSNNNRQRLPFIPGSVTLPDSKDAGCVFRMRCPAAASTCSQPQPLHDVGQGHHVRCPLAKKI